MPSSCRIRSLKAARFLSLVLDPQGGIPVVAYSQGSDKARIISARRAGPGEGTQYARRDASGIRFLKRHAGSGGFPGAGKTRITIRFDDDLLEWLKRQVEAARGGKYQSLINAALRQHVQRQREPPEATLRRVAREELLNVRKGSDGL